LQFIVEVPEPVILVGLNEQYSPGEGETEPPRVTVPMNCGLRLIVEPPFTPATIDSDVGLAERPKSWTYTVKVVLCESDPLVAVTVTW